MSHTSGHNIIKEGYESYVTAGWEKLLCKTENFHTVSQTDASFTMHLDMLFYIKDQHNTQNIFKNKHNFNIPPTSFGQSWPPS